MQDRQSVFESEKKQERKAEEKEEKKKKEKKEEQMNKQTNLFSITNMTLDSRKDLFF